MSLISKLRSKLAQTIAAFPGLHYRLRRIYCFIGLGTRTDRDFLFNFARTKKDVFFLEIGANDGDRGDPIHYFVKEYNWSGIALEPVPDIFEKLKSTYRGNKNVRPICAALSNQDGRMTFYRVRSIPEVPAFCSELGSFSREVILSHKHLFPQIEEHIIRQEVDAVRFSTLVESENITRIDVVLIDTEGYDFEVLKQFDFTRFRPSIVIYEHIHLDDAAKTDSKQMLENLGYAVHNSYNTNYVGVHESTTR